eukprot:7096702-Prymnesium_polylepis.1
MAIGTPCRTGRARGGSPIDSGCVGARAADTVHVVRMPARSRTLVIGGKIVDRAHARAQLSLVGRRRGHQ